MFRLYRLEIDPTFRNYFILIKCIYIYTIKEICSPNNKVKMNIHILTNSEIYYMVCNLKELTKNYEHLTNLKNGYYNVLLLKMTAIVESY